jgi:4-aminobutyrate aminotransferase-like enzyme
VSVSPADLPVGFGSLLPDLVEGPPGPVSRSFAARLHAVESRNVTFLADAWPIFWEAARGANVLDADGNVLVDMSSGFGVALLGHGHPAVVAAVEDQLRRLTHGMGDVHPPTVKLKLLERLSELSPWEDTRSVLATTGSEAVEVALKSALLATGKAGVLAFEGGYHGLTLGSLAATQRDLFRRPFTARLYPGVAFAPFPREPDRGGSSVDVSLESVRAALTRGAPNGDPIGAIIVEPVQGRAGVRVAPAGFMAELSALAAEADVVVIADEIQTGIGRCGALFASELVGLRPDLICVGKALGGGMPISACLGSRAVMDAWPPSEGEAVHTSTFMGHPLSCASALAALRATEAEDAPAGAERLGARLMEALTRRLSGVPGVGEVRGMGLLLGVELVRANGGPAAGSAAGVTTAALRRGVIVLPAGDHGDVVELTPPVVLTGEQADYAVEVLVSAIAGGI